jgi:hypothetical protein
LLVLESVKLLLEAGQKVGVNETGLEVALDGRDREDIRCNTGFSDVVEEVFIWDLSKAVLLFYGQHV